jgi:hypothetical protein
LPPWQSGLDSVRITLTVPPGAEATDEHEAADDAADIDPDGI